MTIEKPNIDERELLKDSCSGNVYLTLTYPALVALIGSNDNIQVKLRQQIVKE